ncbi:MAG TPA: hypothetical protein VHA52_02250 [Candidatus Babeliaceae bacterium]|nr:hypothetical protein [Candidatus Babeliaceae bacterium]
MSSLSQVLPSSGGSVSAIQTINGDVGSVSGITVSFNASTNGADAGSSVEFSGSSTQMNFVVTDSEFNTLIGQGAGNSTLVSNGANSNAGFGASCLASLSTGNNNMTIGSFASFKLSTGNNNCAMGTQALYNLSSGNNNIGIGGNTNNGFVPLGGFMSDGSDNVIIGCDAGQNWSGSESSNILIGSNVVGTSNQNNTLIIGAGTGSGRGQIAAGSAFISGIYGGSPSSPQMVTINSSNQLGSQALPSSPALVLIQTQSISSGSPVTEIDFTTGLSYNNYLIITDNIVNPGNDGVSFPNIGVQLSTDGGSTYINSGYYQNGGSGAIPVLIIANIGSATSYISSNQTLINVKGNSGFISLIGTSSEFDTSFSVLPNISTSGGIYGTTIIADALRIVMDDSSPFYGTVSLYGVTQ